MNRLPGFVAETTLKPSGPAYRGAAGRAATAATGVPTRIAVGVRIDANEGEPSGLNARLLRELASRRRLHRFADPYEPSRQREHSLVRRIFAADQQHAAHAVYDDAINGE